jgi:MraZ protein
MENWTGETNVILDEKGRLSLPARFRNPLSGNTLVLTQGADDCLWLYLPEEWRGFLKVIMDTTSPFSARSRIVRRQIIGPAQEVEIDKAGRIPVPQSLREYADLSRECTVVGPFDYIEIWSAERYKSYKNAHAEEFDPAAEEIWGMLRQQGAEKEGV